jgi:hypothetical protein
LARVSRREKSRIDSCKIESRILRELQAASALPRKR